MVKQIRKRMVFGLSMIASSIVGFMFVGGKGSTSYDVDSLLEKPIFSIETARADAGAGDCCCGCDTGDPPPPPPSSAWVYIDIDTY